MPIRLLLTLSAIGAMSGCALPLEKYFTANPTCGGSVTDIQFQTRGCLTGVEYPAARKKAQQSLKEAAQQEEQGR